MATSYNWVVNSMSTLNPTSGEQDYVVQANYSVIATETIDKVDYTSQIDNAAFFEVNSSQTNFIPYDQLTNEIVVGWIQEQMGVDAVGNVESTLSAQIQAQANPAPSPQPTPLPWANA